MFGGVRLGSLGLKESISADNEAVDTSRATNALCVATVDKFLFGAGIDMVGVIEVAVRLAGVGAGERTTLRAMKSAAIPKRINMKGISRRRKLNNFNGGPFDCEAVSDIGMELSPVSVWLKTVDGSPVEPSELM